MTDPGKHVVTLSDFRWLGGMLLHDGHRLTNRYPGEEGLTTIGLIGNCEWHPEDGDYPDLDDPVTCLAILVLVREKHPGAYVVNMDEGDPGNDWNHVVYFPDAHHGPDEDLTLGHGATEKEALVEALEAERES